MPCTCMPHGHHMHHVTSKFHDDYPDIANDGDAAPIQGMYHVLPLQCLVPARHMGTTCIMCHPNFMTIIPTSQMMGMQRPSSGCTTFFPCSALYLHATWAPHALRDVQMMGMQRPSSECTTFSPCNALYLYATWAPHASCDAQIS